MPAPPSRRRRRLALAALALLVGGPVAAIAVGGLTTRPRPADVAVVLGTKVEPPGVPCPRLADRLDRAAELYRAGTVRWVIASGALGREGYEEADVMAAYLSARGVPDGRIVRDREGWTTWDTAHNARAIMERRGWGSVVVVSNYFHVPRAELAFRRAGVAEVSGARSRLRPGLREPYALAREVAAYGWYAVR